MGVKNLWTILSGVGEITDLRELQGKRVAVDLAGWIVQSNQCKAMNNRVTRPHLRNVFFRAAALQALNIQPIFVFDGDAPALKQQTLQVRRAAEQTQSQSQSQSSEPVKLSRNRLKSVMGECRALLNALGFQCVLSTGEAEALCARLDAEGLVDAVITEDSDAFCYGAKTILRNFSISPTGNSVEMYSATKLSDLLSITRDRMIFMAVILGCDFFHTGIPGVGKELILQLFSMWPKHWRSLNALKFWSKKGFPFDEKKGKAGLVFKCSICLESSNHCSDCREWMDLVSDGECHCRYLVSAELFKLENNLKKKCSIVDVVWWQTDFQKILDEFEDEQKIPELKKSSNFQAPDFDKCVEILVKKLSWTEEYAVEKMLPVLTRWQVKHFRDHPSKRSNEEIIRPERISKKRVRDGNPSFDLVWTSLDQNSKFLPPTFESCEPAVFVRDAYPKLIEEFEATINAKKKPSKPRQTKTTKLKAPTLESQPSSQQPAITNFFTQKKVNHHATKTAANVPDKVPNIAACKPVAKSLKEIAPVPMPSSALVHRIVERLQHSRTDMSIDPSDDSYNSDLSMIIDDFIHKKVEGHNIKENVAPDQFVTSTPYGRMTRESIKPVGFEPKPASRSARPGCEPEPNLAKNDPVQSLMAKVENDLSMMSLDRTNEDSFDRMCKF